MGTKVLIIGLDGATPDLVERWVAENKLPYLKQMMQNGVYGTLKSTYPPISPAAWTTFATGYNPGKHGTYDFRNYDPRRIVALPTRSSIRTPLPAKLSGTL